MALKKYFGFKKLLLTALVLAPTLIASSPAMAWDTWGINPMQSTMVNRLSPDDATVPTAFQSAFKPYMSNRSTTLTTLSVEFNFFYATFTAGNGVCTSGSTAGTFECPGGISVQVTQPDGNPYSISNVELLERPYSSWSSWNVVPGAPADAHAATLVVTWTSPTAVNFEDTLTEVSFPANAITLPSTEDLAKPQGNSAPYMFWGGAAFNGSRSPVTQYIGSMTYVTADSTTSNGSLANTGSEQWLLMTLAGGLICTGYIARVFSYAGRGKNKPIR